MAYLGGAALGPLLALLARPMPVAQLTRRWQPDAPPGMARRVIGQLAAWGVVEIMPPVEGATRSGGRRTAPAERGGGGLARQGLAVRARGLDVPPPRGGPYERGFQHGWLLAKELAEVLRVNRYLTLWQTGNDFDWFGRMAVQMYGHKVEAELVEEMHGIAAGAKRAGLATSFAEILAWNANLEMIGSWWPLVAQSPPGLNLTQHRCSAFIATGKGWTKDGGIVMGHNTWDTYANGAHSSIVMEIVPTDGFNILMQSAPGLIHSGTDFFQLGSGIIGCETSFAGFNKYDDKKTPEFARVRQAMQYAVDLDHWMQIMRTDNNGGYANSWLLGDRARARSSASSWGSPMRGSSAARTAISGAATSSAI